MNAFRRRIEEEEDERTQWMGPPVLLLMSDLELGIGGDGNIRCPLM